MSVDILDMKFFVKVTTNRLNPLVVIKRKKKTLPLLPHILALGSRGTPQL